MARLKFDATQGVILHDTEEFRISYYNSTSDKSPKAISLSEFVRIIKTKNTSVEQIRSSTDKATREALKSRLPCVTISGVFNGGHKESDLVHHSGLICMDFDAAENPHIIDHESEWRDKLAEDRFVRLSFITVSGHGLAAVVEVSPMFHQRAFLALQTYFKNEYNLVADKACKDIPRLRFVSYDANIRENPHAVLFQRYSLADEERPQELTFDATAPVVLDVTASKKMDASDSLVITPTRRAEIASALEHIYPDNRQDWLEIGMAIKSESSHLSAFNLWREWSMLNDTANKYNEYDLARVWKSIGSKDGITIATLFKKAKDHGWTEPPVEMGTMIPVVSASTYLNNEPPNRNFIIKGLIEENDYVELIAPSKCRKTFFAIYLGLCVATQRQFLNWEVYNKNKVLYVNLEIKTANLHRRIGRMCKAMGLEPNEVDNFYALNLRGVEMANPLDSICKVIKDLRPALTIIDPMYLIHSEAENDQQAMTQVVRKLTKTIEQYHTSILVVHHDAKGTAGDRNNRDRGSGSGVLMRVSDVRMILTPHAEDPDNNAVVEIVGREIPPSEGVSLTFAEGCFYKREDIPAVKENTTQKLVQQEPRVDWQTYMRNVISKLIEEIKASKKGLSSVELRYLIGRFGVTNRNKQSEVMQELRYQIDCCKGNYCGVTYEKKQTGTNQFTYKEWSENERQ
jgi:hypothetical protein